MKPGAAHLGRHRSIRRKYSGASASVNTPLEEGNLPHGRPCVSTDEMLKKKCHQTYRAAKAEM